MIHTILRGDVTGNVLEPVGAWEVKDHSDRGPRRIPPA